MNKKITMNKKSKKPKIALIGVYPPPYGGVSVHIQRLNEQLKKKGFECIAYDLGDKRKISQKNVESTGDAKGWLLKYFLNAKEDIVHYIGYGPKSLFFFSLFSLIRKKKVLITIASFRYNIQNMSGLHKFVFWIASNTNIYFIAVNSQIKVDFISLGIKPENIEVIHPFIPPTIQKQDTAEIATEVWDFIDGRNPVISANAYKIVFYNGQDLYGIDMCIELMSNLQKHYPEIGLVFCLPTIGDYKYFKKLQQQIKQKKLENNILFITEPIPETYPIWMRSDIFVRPTNTDGDALSIREAMYFKTPVVTSDVVTRPKGVVLFKNRNVHDFIEKTKDVLDNYKKYKNITNKLDPGSGFNKILEIYNELAK